MLNVFLTSTILVCAVECNAQDKRDWIDLFDGSTLAGWRGDSTFWSVEDGAIVGKSTLDQPCNYTTYLHYEKPFADFELVFEIKLEGDAANSGMQYRSTPLGPDVGDGFDLRGYQADFDAPHNYSGMLYETGGRGIAARRGESKRFMVDGSTRVLAPIANESVLSEHLDAGWHHVRILADGEHLDHFINGEQMLRIEDAAPTRSESGILALQLHQGAPMTVRVRNVRIRVLGEIVDQPVANDTTEAEWIWSTAPATDGQRLTFARDIELKANATFRVQATCDNEFKLAIDGKQVVQGDDWGRLFAAHGELKAGKHRIEVECINGTGPAGFLGWIDLKFDDGTTQRIASDTTWRTAGGVTSFGTQSNHTGPWGKVANTSAAAGTHTWSLPEGFEAELLVSAQSGDGSWVACAFDARGRLVVSPQYGPLARISFGPSGAVARVEPLPDTSGPPLSHAQGLLYAHDALWVNVSRNEKNGGGLWVLRDTDGDDVFDEREHVGHYGNGSEHGCHGVALAPDGAIWVVNGNHTPPPNNVSAESPFRGWHEDQLLERVWDPNGHAVGVVMPAGCVNRYDPKTKVWTTIAGGFRNPYDLAFSPAGECFVYDADMEWDIGTPWFIWPLVQHIVAGGDYGWRSGTGKVPMWANDRMAAVCATDVSSPTGVGFATESHFPEPWRSRLFIGDWSYGRLLAVELDPEGSTYTGSVHEFARGTPLNITDFSFGPDGALYLLTGGRRTQSGLYRISATQPLAVDAQSDLAAREARVAPSRKNRAAMHEETDHRVLLTALDSDDPALRLVARNRLRLTDPILALDELTGQSLRVQGEVFLACAQEQLGIAAVGEGWLDAFAQASGSDQRGLLRVLAVALARGPQPEESMRLDLLDALDPLFPSDDFETDRQLLELLVALGASDLPARAIDLLHAEPDPARQLALVMAMRTHARDWTSETYGDVLDWCEFAATLQGGHSLRGFVAAACERLQASVPAELTVERQLAAGFASATIAVDPEEELGRMPDVVRHWRLDELLALARADSTKPDLERGARVFRGALCIQCHRFAGEGGTTGSDLTGVAGRFSREDLLRAIVEPSASISDQYAQCEVILKEGGRLVGRRLGADEDEVVLNVNPFGRTIRRIPMAAVERIEILQTSAMPAGLLDVLLPEEILDLVEFLESGNTE